jgi:chromosome segregation ATPase
MPERDFRKNNDSNENSNQIQEGLIKKDQEIDDLKENLNQLQIELNKKNNEIVIYSQKLATLEDEIITLRELLSDDSSKKKGKKVKETKLTLDLEAKNSEIRQLKDKMGFLRKEKIAVQKQLEKYKEKNKSNSTVLRVEDLRKEQPLNMLVKDLQEKIKKQETLIKRLSRDGNIQDFEETITHKDNIIESLNQKVGELTEKLKNIEKQVEKESSGRIQKKILQDLQDKLNRFKRINEELNAKLEKHQKKENKETESEKDKKIRELESKIKDLSLRSLGTNSHQKSTLDQVIEELQNKLNKSKVEVQILKEQITNNNPEKSAPNNNDQLKIQREMAIFLQNQLDDAKRALKTKVEEIGTIKNEAIRIKRKYEELENQVKAKEQIYNNLRNDFESLKVKTQLQSNSNSTQSPQIELRIQELKSQIDDLTKQNIQQRLEINQLRKSV